ncbi:Protein ssh4 [Coemansia javaensis]|uniref:Protein ssh4 n=1 Tax=Coemansia javaensis TaxID=2761396 RepID=A0A9W8LK83_9FUNG|nr:Protein ssh4 [Coemansia javaensis]
MNPTAIAIAAAVGGCAVVVALLLIVAIHVLWGAPVSLARLRLSCDRRRRQRRHRRRCRGEQREDEAHAKAQRDIGLLPLDSVLARLEGTRAQRNYVYACQYVAAHPADESEGRLSDRDHELVMESGAAAWEFAPAAGVAVRNGTEIEFAGGEQSVLASLQFPNEQRVYYYEVRLAQLPEATNVAVGVAMRGYPPQRMAGWARHSVAYHTIDGTAYYSHPLDACRRALGRARTSDTVGVGWRPNSGKMFIAINGRFVCHIRTPWARKRMYPIVSADGPCALSVNVGARAFVLAQANMRHWSLASTEGLRLPPPMYQHISGTVLLEEGPSTRGHGGRCHPPPYDGSSSASLISPSPDHSVLSMDAASDSAATPGAQGRMGRAGSVQSQRRSAGDPRGESGRRRDQPAAEPLCAAPARSRSTPSMQTPGS